MSNPERRAMPQRRRIYLVRHGDVTYFDAHGKPYRPDTVPLNEEGRRQAAMLARELAEAPIDRVVTSDLNRCTETAAILTAGRNVTVEPRAELREIQPGRLADVPLADIERAFLGAFATGITPESRFLGGESYASLAERVNRAFTSLLDEPDWRYLLVVAHGGVNRAILTRALCIGLDGFGCFEQDPACLNILDVDSTGRCLVRLVNHTPYNQSKIGIELTTMERLFLQYRHGAQ